MRRSYLSSYMTTLSTCADRVLKLKKFVLEKSSLSDKPLVFVKSFIELLSRDKFHNVERVAGISTVWGRLELIRSYCHRVCLHRDIRFSGIHNGCRRVSEMVGWVADLEGYVRDALGVFIKNVLLSLMS